MHRGINMNRSYSKHGQYHCNRPQNGREQHMQQPVKDTASELQCLKLVTSAHTSVAGCLNAIDRNIACFTRLLTDGFTRVFRAVHVACGTVKPLAKLFPATFWSGSHQLPLCPHVNQGKFRRCSA